MVDVPTRARAVYVEDWQAAYGSPYLVQAGDLGTPDAVLVEDGDRLVRHAGTVIQGAHDRVAFVDGVRRGEAALYQHDRATGRVARGVAGGHACGAVVADGERQPSFTREQVQRLVIWGSGLEA